MDENFKLKCHLPPIGQPKLKTVDFKDSEKPVVVIGQDSVVIFVRDGGIYARVH